MLGCVAAGAGRQGALAAPIWRQHAAPLVRDGPQYSLDPTGQDYQRLSQWIENNRSGWHRLRVQPVDATPRLSL
jgi:hypothetical protein